MEKTILDEMKLPLVNPNEELEDISNNRFVPLFDVSKFEIRKEPGRDKGIDFRIEIKKNGRFTGFRFIVQLKATEKIEANEDGSVSLTIYTSNINYLLNSGVPAFYVLYFKKENTFLYENLNDFVKNIVEQKQDLQKQDSHALRLHKQLDLESIELMYKRAHDHGIFSRNLNQQLALSSSLVSERILIDPQLNVTSDSEIRKLIEQFGLHLINESRWIDVLEAHHLGSQNISITAKYNLIIGIAFYYTGELIKSLSYFKSAIKLKSELTQDLFEHLILFDATVRYSLGLISKNEHQDKLLSIGTSDHIKYYLKIDQEKELYLKSDDPDIDLKYEKFVREMEDILNSEDANDNIKLLVKCELVLFEGTKINMDYARDISRIKAYESIIGEDRQIRITQLKEILQRKFSWAEKAREIKEEAVNTKSYFVLFHVVVNETKVNYEFEVYTDLVNFDKNPSVDSLSEERIIMIDGVLKNLEQAINYFRQISHIENLCVGLSIKYEILHFKKDLEEAEKVLNELSQIIDNYELKDNQRKIESLRNKGTTHEKLKAFFDEVSTQTLSRQDEYDKMVKDMKLMDEQELKKKIAIKESDVIQLYPINHFQFPKSERETVYDILNVALEAREGFDYMLDQIKAIPVANIYNNPIVHEGFGDDPILNNSIESWRNIYRIRKSFFEKGFPRIRLKF
jgi:Domain of unknown function (DUF4365)